jgi:hypothetical protein
MKLVAAITDKKVLRRILEHLGLWPQPEPVPTKPRAPPAPTPHEVDPGSDVDDVSQVPAWWDEDEAYSQLPPEDAA